VNTIGRIEIDWPSLGLTVTADLDDRNARLAQALLDVLPYRSLQGHALIAGYYLYHVTPIHSIFQLPTPHRVDRRTLPDGTLFGSRLQHFGIRYGTLTEPMPATPIGRIDPADLDALTEAGRATWDSVYSSKKPIIAEVRHAGRPGGHNLPRLAATDPVADRLIADIHAETTRAWLEPPAELLDLHDGRIRSGAGSYGTTMTTMLFVNGESRPLGYSVYGGLIKAASENLPMDALHHMTRILAGTPGEFLAYCGLETLGHFTTRLLACLDRLHTRDDFIAVMAHMALYVHCLGGWNLQLFPWHLGEHLRTQPEPR
jgi:hypothetical protein